MNTEKIAFNKVAKIKEKVELSMLDQFEEAQKNAKDGLYFARKHKKDIQSAINQANKDTNKGISESKQAIYYLETIIKKADEIGINYPDASKDKSELESILKRLEDVSLSYGKALKAIYEV